MRSDDLPRLRCPCCGKDLVPPRRETVAVASSFAGCLRRCDVCGVGYSNTSKVGAETRIYRDASDNVPSAVRNGFVDTLSTSVNLLNRDNKRQKAAFETSEDAMTWSVFRGLQLAGGLQRTLCRVGIEVAENASHEPSLLLWGAGVPAGDPGTALISGALEDISRYLREPNDRRTEPDVVLGFNDAAVIFVEVKYLSKNERPKSGCHWDRYMERPDADAFLDTQKLVASRYYELARNWRFAWEVSRRFNVPVALVNLGLPTLFEGADRDVLCQFESLLMQDLRHRFY